MCVRSWIRTIGNSLYCQTNGRCVVAICLVATVYFLGSSASDAAQYTVADIGAFPGGVISQAFAINKSGQVTGFATAPVVVHDAFLYSLSGGLHDLSTLGGDESEAEGINDSSQVVGWSLTTNDAAGNPFLYTPGSGMVDIGPLVGSGVANDVNNSTQVTGWADRIVGSTLTERGFIFTPGVGTITLGAFGTHDSNRSHAQSINDSGQVAGWSDLDNNNYHAFLYSGGVMSDIGTLGGTLSRGFGINASGQVTGFANTKNDAGRHGFLYTPVSGMADLGVVPGGVASDGLGLNDSGQVVGYTEMFDNTFRAWLYTAGAGMQDLNTLIPAGSGWMLSQATAINNTGQIVGYGTNPAGHTDAFLLTPVPEPASLTLLGIGAIPLLSRRRRLRWSQKGT